MPNTTDPAAVLAAPLPSRPSLHHQLRRYLPASLTTPIALRILATVGWTLLGVYLLSSTWVAFLFSAVDSRADPAVMALFGLPMLIGAATLPVAAVLVWVVPRRGAGAKSKALLKQVGLVVPAAGAAVAPLWIAGLVVVGVVQEWMRNGGGGGGV